MFDVNQMSWIDSVAAAGSSEMHKLKSMVQCVN